MAPVEGREKKSLSTRHSSSFSNQKTYHELLSESASPAANTQGAVMQAESSGGHLHSLCEPKMSPARSPFKGPRLDVPYGWMEGAGAVKNKIKNNQKWKYHFILKNSNEHTTPSATSVIFFVLFSFLVGGYVESRLLTGASIVFSTTRRLLLIFFCE